MSTFFPTNKGQQYISLIRLLQKKKVFSEKYAIVV